MTDPRPLPAGCVRRCPGCAHRHLSLAQSAARKHDWLAQRLADWADRLQPVVAVDEATRWHYRDRVCLKAQWRGDGWQIGMNLDDEVLAIPDCPVHSARVRDTLHALLAHLPPGENFPLAYVAQSGAQLTLVLKTRDLPPPDWLAGSLASDLEAAGVEGLWLHLHPSVGRKIFNKPGWHLLWGEPRSRDAEGLYYGPVGFQQLIPALYRRALDQARDFLAPGPDTQVVDLYSGGGTTLRRWHAAGADCIGVELGAQSCECAALNVPQAVTLRGKCEHRLPQLNAWMNEKRRKNKIRLLYLNPPRTGLEAQVREWITAEYKPARIAYLSCSAGTLYRDLQALTKVGYRVEALSPYDFFPNTWHVETLALLHLW